MSVFRTFEQAVFRTIDQGLGRVTDVVYRARPAEARPRSADGKLWAAAAG